MRCSPVNGLMVYTGSSCGDNGCQGTELCTALKENDMGGNLQKCNFQCHCTYTENCDIVMIEVTKLGKEYQEELELCEIDFSK